MKVYEFNISKGIYIFNFDSLDTAFHSHPAIEIVSARKGTFTLWTEHTKIIGLTFAVIQANEKHKISSADCDVHVTMIEHHTKFVTDILSHYGINMLNGLYFQTSSKKAENITQEIYERIMNSDIIMEYDDRILATINYLSKNDLEYDQMITTLKKITNLSESRLSHLFKANLGISLKRYLVWTKLKSTIKQHLFQKDNLFDSLIKSGFYDHPHFSKNFKAMLGVKASKAYNSRTLQVLPVIPS